MVAAVAFVPSPPLLLTALGGGPASLRSACAQAISVLGGLDVVVLGAAPADGWLTGSIDATPWGAPGPATDDALPLALAVGSTLLGDRPHALYGVAGGGLPPLGDVGLLVVGDGSARRAEKAPGHLDDRAAGFDAQVEAALAAGDPALLAALDAALGVELLAGGVPVWQAVSQLSGTWRGEVHLSDAPYGVGYFAASWTPLLG
jgi:hypothetical protein